MLRETHKHELTSFIFPYSATSSRGVASFLLFWRNNAHSQGKWIHFCSQVSIFIYIYTGILGTSDLALSFFSRPKRRACPCSLYFYLSFSLSFVFLLNNFPLQKCPFYRDCATTDLRMQPYPPRNTNWWDASTQAGGETKTPVDQRRTMTVSLLWPLWR